MTDTAQVSYIYTLCDPATGEVRYVGKTDNLERRYKDHLNYRSKPRTHKNNWIRRLALQGLSPVMMVLEETTTEAASERECWHIANLRSAGSRLTNTTNGGDGVAGLRHTEESRRRMSEKAQGRTVSVETRRKLSEAHKRLFTPEVRQHYSEIFRGRQFSAEIRQKISQGRKGMKFTPEHIANMSLSRRGKPAHNKGKPLSLEQRQAVAEAQRGLSHDNALIVLDMIAAGIKQVKIAHAFSVSPSVITSVKQGRGCYQKARKQWDSRVR